MDREYSDTKGPLVKAGVLIIVLVLVFLLKDRLPKMTDAFFSNFDEKGKKVRTYNFSEEDQKAVRKEVAGFWQADYKTRFGHNILTRIEAQGIGYFYWYDQKSITLPNDSVFSYIVQREDFLIPHSQEEGSSSYICDLYRKNASYVFDDTCKENMNDADERYKMLTVERISEDTLKVDTVTYTLYTGKLYDFFPVNITKTIGSNEVITCHAKDNTIDKCKEAIENSIKDLTYSEELQNKLLKKYYFPLALVERDLNLPFGEGKPFTMKLSINTDGSVKTVDLSGPLTTSPAVKNAIRDEMKSWKFLPHAEENSLTYTEILK